jgi:hypothetical protein
MAVVRLQVTRREPVLGGVPFGDAGAYEKIEGVLHLAVDPALPVHAPIADLGLAPRNARGLVESSADFYLLRPLGGGSRRLLLDVPNRGRKIALGMFNSAPRSNDPSTREDFGNGFLMRHGYTVAWVGWQPDVPRRDGMMALTVPRVPGVSERVRCEFRPNARVDVLPLADRYHVPHPVARPDDPDAELHVREHAQAPALTVPRTAWRFPDATSVTLDGGFEAGRIYECYYRAENPPVVGLGFTAVRDVASFLRWGTAGEGNPCAGAVEKSYVFGVSQSGRFLRHLLYLGLDEDEAGRFVWDALIPHVAGARRGEFNCRFGQPSLNALHAVGSLFPFTDGEQDDPLTGERDGLLRRLASRAAPPRIFTINTAAEYWRGDGSLLHTDVTGARDVAPRPYVRQYLFAGTQHTPGTIPPPPADPNTGGRGRHPFNVVDYSPLLRAALVNLDRWVSEGVEPPASAVPRLADGTAVPAEALRSAFAAIPGARFPPRARHRLHPAPQDRGGLRDLRGRGGRGRQRAGGHPSARAPRAPRDLHRVEPATPRAGRAGRSHGHDGLDAAVRAHRPRAGRDGRPAPLDRGAVRGPRRLPCARARRGGGAGDGSVSAGRGRGRGGRPRRIALGLRQVPLSSPAPISEQLGLPVLPGLS